MKNLLDILNWRYAVKKFDPNKKISEAKLNTLKEALRLTPSSLGLQPWKFLLVENPAIRAQLQEHSWNQSQITEASHLIVLCRLEKIDEPYIDTWIDYKRTLGDRTEEALQGYKQMILNLVINKHSDNPDFQTHYLEKQIYLALGNLLTSAAVLELDTCPIGGFDPQKYDEILGLKEKGLRSCVVCPIGYRHAEDRYQNYPKARFPQEQIFETI
ncbi:NAD(P)H-dependent oxidoreductase [bacterium DOLZORAL124_38_8]|nr:MAG: NAD(P)H-dependent oxidoreductase [bacterium DOLZORAL124_38_8]